MTTSCWNPKCSETEAFEEYRGKSVCGECLENVYRQQSFCPGCGLGYGPTEEPEDPENYYIGCDYCDKWTHRFCDPKLSMGFYDRHLLSQYACPECRDCKPDAFLTWNFLTRYLKQSRTNEDQPIVLIDDEHLILVSVQETSKAGSPRHPCILLGFDFINESKPIVLLCLGHHGKTWLQWYQKPENVFEWSDTLEKCSSEWDIFSAEIEGKTFLELPKLARKRIQSIRARLTFQPKIEINDLAVGLVDPSDDHDLLEDHVGDEPLKLDFKSLDIVWAKVPGMPWAPAVISFAYAHNPDTPYVVFFLERSKKITNENSVPIKSSNIYLPKWLIDEQDTILTGEELADSFKYAFLPAGPNSVKPWDCLQSEGFMKLIKTSKRKDLIDAIALANCIVKGVDQVPIQIRKDSLARERAQLHTEQSFKAVQAVKPAIKLQHLKLFIETNMVEMHWRVIARARQYVKVVHDEFYGGWHLIAAQDWPTDRDISEGVESDVFLVYPGEILTSAEALAMESESADELHLDVNRYVAEIPNTSVILDKSGSANINTSGTNLFVNGIKYCDPKSELWAPGPTVNHERVEYCKLEPHHSTTDNMRGFWLQRKKGETILRGEPLFWSYDCGAGKFDEDFGLVGKPPPPGWRSSRKRAKPQVN